MANNEEAQLDAATQDELKSAVNRALNTPSTAAPLLGLPDINLGDKVKGAVDVLDQTIKALTVLQQYKWVIPDQYEAPLDALLKALTKVRSWVS